jgi:hypothetical protein
LQIGRIDFSVLFGKYSFKKQQLLKAGLSLPGNAG